MFLRDELLKKFTVGIVSFATSVFFNSIFFVLSAFPIMWIWNWLVPQLFGGPLITFWQVIGLKILFVLFKAVVSVNVNT